MLFPKENNKFRKSTFSLRVASRTEKVPKMTSNGSQMEPKMIKNASKNEVEKTMKK